MTAIRPIDLSGRLSLPGDRAGVVIAQPHVPDDSLSAVEPYQIKPNRREAHLAAIRKTLDIARAVPHGVSKTHFTVFPEYSIPGEGGIELVDAALKDPAWPNGTVVIGGTDALTQAQYAALIAEPTTHVDTSCNSTVSPQHWVNTAITWIKMDDGVVERWVQPKLHPAWPELNIAYQHMFCGQSIFVFEGRFANNTPFRFASLVCFDFIARLPTKKAFEWIMENLESRAAQGQHPFSWLFVIQRNEKPSHHDFLNTVVEFFDQTKFPNAIRDRACVIFANTAGGASPGRVRYYGACSLVLAPQSLFSEADCAPTYSKGGARFRDGSNGLSNCKDVFFRERGACIHSFAQINPGSLPVGPAGRAFPVDQAYVHPIDGGPQPRAPGAPVAAAVKWINDEIDGVRNLAATYSNVPLAALLDVAHGQNVQTLRQLSGLNAARAVRLATPLASKREDDWDRAESEALSHIVDTLAIIRTAQPTVVTGEEGHARVTIAGHTLEVIAVRGASHEECMEHARRIAFSPHSQALVVTRDEDNTSLDDRTRSFLEPKRAVVGDEAVITDPTGRLLYVSFRSLLHALFSAADTAALGAEIDALAS